MRGWLAVNLFLLVMVLVGAGLLWLSFVSIRALHLSIEVERVLIAIASLVAIVGAFLWGKCSLAWLEKRARA